NAQGGTQLQLGDADTGVAQAAEGSRRLLKLQRAVTDVVTHADVTPQRGSSLIESQPGLRGERRAVVRGVQIVTKEANRLADRVQVAAWLGFKREPDLASGLAFDLHQLRHMTCDVAGHLPRDTIPARKRLEGAGHRRDRADQPRRQQPGKYPGNAVGV